MDTENNNGLAGLCALGVVGAYVYLVCKLPALLTSRDLSNTKKSKTKIDGFGFNWSEHAREKTFLPSTAFNSLCLNGKPSQTMEMKKVRRDSFVMKKRGGRIGFKVAQAAPPQLNQPEPENTLQTALISLRAEKGLNGAMKHVKAILSEPKRKPQKVGRPAAHGWTDEEIESAAEDYKKQQFYIMEGYAPKVYWPQYIKAKGWGDRVQHKKALIDAVSKLLKKKK